MVVSPRRSAAVCRRAPQYSMASWSAMGGIRLKA